ncbi:MULTISPECIES: LysR family transcriptional regulator [Paenibacillus]|uniref:DNA-binding transcriptional LysR family regulator n=2 Tax=Paenibacillus lactis TaxID=228574 RepID=A0ABS4F608_9BACL|nr:MULTISPECIES: LysR family transcriptional regulator [Paenibacillus]MBP1891684.1 DNA-binding transcriptional LysR family regulator [Paenibacillus lactis]HAF97903.1 LysR family transcriptional regulator [Paenibacillus lactis]
MDIRDMQIFLAVANEGSFTRAAEKLEYVQSSISIRIQQLESELNTELFHRGRQGVRLTSSGEALKSYAEKIIFLTQEAERVVSDRSIPRGPLRIGSLETTTAIRLPSILAEYHHSYPDVDLVLRTGTTEELVHSVLKYELDGAFVSSPGEHAELETVEVGAEELVLLSGGQTDPIHRPEHLRHLTILVFRVGCHYRRILEDWLHAKGVSAKIMEFGTLEGILGFIHAGLGVSLLPRSVIERAMMKYNLQSHNISDEFLRTPTLFIRRKDTFKTAAVSEFIRISKERFNDI